MTTPLLAMAWTPLMRFWSPNLRSVLALAMLAAVGCSSLTTLGVSEGQKEEGSDAPTLESGAVVSREQRSPTEIVAGESGVLSPAWGELGDVDGDGFDDFLMMSAADPDPPFISDFSLFYGRPEFPALLVADSAEAVFESFDSPRPLGDINCDGLADFAVAVGGDWGLVFGDRARFSGRQTAASQKVVWRAAPREPGFGGLSLFKAGDVDGDGCDELIVHDERLAPPEQQAGRPGGFLTNTYLIAGRADGWPSGDFDPSWAVAAFGDDDPLDRGAKYPPLVRGLSVSSTGDLDGDGYADIVAHGTAALYVYYGGPSGLHGTLLPSDASAKLAVPLKNNGELDTEKMPILAGDVDNDGTDDFQFPNYEPLADHFGIQYGTKQRWSGTVSLAPELTIQGVDMVALASEGDIDGDTVPELAIVQLEQDEWDGVGPVPTVTTTVYLSRAAARHATGTYVLGDADLYHSSATGLELGGVDTNSALFFAGDLDGDGSDDLFYVGEKLLPDQATTGPGGVYLIPGTPRAPD